MIRSAWRWLVKFLVSARLALVLILFVGVWSMVATAIPQDATSPAEVAHWASENATIEPVVKALGLHHAFSAPIFVGAVILLALSSAVCAWGRTRIAMNKARTLRETAAIDRDAVAASHDMEISSSAQLDEAQLLAKASETLAELGIKTKERGGVLLSVSPWWSVWGSAVFHWALVALVIAVFAGMLFRAEGAMSVVVGGEMPDTEESYLSVETGRLHDWARVKRTIRVDDFEPGAVKDGIELGAVPTVTVLDGEGRVRASQRVYPNQKLHAGSLSIYSPACGLAVTLALTNPSGQDFGQVTQLVDFSQEASGGTVPVQPMVASDDNGQVLMRLEASVPLDPDPQRGGYGEWIPKTPAARVVLTDGSGATLLDKVVRQGETVNVEGGGTVRLVGIGWFAALVLVDDPTIPFIYAAMILAMLGLTLSVSVRQQLVAATVIDGPDGKRLALKLRLWRNVPTTRDEIEDELNAALGAEKEETGS